MTELAQPPTAANVHKGGCLCGAIRFRATADPVQTTVCHCTFCQRLTGHIVRSSRSQTHHR